MRGGPRRVGYRIRLTAIAGLGLSLLAPFDAVALDSDLKGSAVFKLKASHGYTVLGFASSERIDGRGDIGLIVYRNGASVSYLAPATVTPTRLDADLGALGRISAEIVPSGKKETLRSRCGGDAIRGFEPDLYRGTFEFRGEGGYTEAVAMNLPEYTQFFLDFICPGVAWSEVSGRGLPGARLRLFSRHGARRLSLQFNKNKPGASTFYEVSLKEQRGELRIERTVMGRQPAAVFEYDPLLRTATVEPAAPFSGAASFHHDAAVPNRWTGDLAVDFPGASDVALAGKSFSIHVVPARRTG